ncbi:MAG: metal-dependent hydrolase [Thermosipho sp. (in: Bacteria)]|nr:metal-dependent hydrolase [Thermosipho sp. (in: thermotogales)]
MKGTSHLVVGAATGIVLSQHVNINPLVTVGLTTLGAIMPDLDEKHSAINKILFPVSIKKKNILKGLVGAVLLLVQHPLAIYIGAIIILSMISSKIEYRFSILKGFYQVKHHRTIFHDPLIGSVIFLVPLLLLKISKIYILIYLLGLITHYIADSFTNYGLPLYILGRKLRMPLTYSSNNMAVEYILVGSYLGLLAYASFLSGV